MPDVLIRNVPADVHERMKERAEQAGQSLNEYLLDAYAEVASWPTWAEMSARLKALPPYEGPSLAALIREDRDSH